MKQIVKIEHSQILPYLLKAPIKSLFPIYVCNSYLNKASYAAFENGIICGTVISGQPFGLFNVYSYWLFAEDEESAALLLEQVVKDYGYDIFVQFEPKFTHLVKKILPLKQFGEDFYFILKPELFTLTSISTPIKMLTQELLSSIIIPEELNNFIGPKSEFYPGIPFYGAIEENTLISIGECMVNSSGYASIQQLYTVTWKRNLGLSSQLASQMIRDLLAQNIMPTYLVSKTNYASVRVAEKLGFKCYTELGCCE